MISVASSADEVAVRSPLRAAEIPELLRALGDIPNAGGAGNIRREMKKKYREFFDSGTRQILEIDPESRTVGIYDVPGPESAKILHENEMLIGGWLLPGFELFLSQLFAELDRQAGETGQSV